MSVRRGGTALALAVLSSLLVAGCGGSEEVAACDSVWVEGKTIPEGYSTCQRGIIIDKGSSDECTDGRVLVKYQDTLFAFLGEPAQTLEGDAGEKAYDAADQLCSGLVDPTKKPRKKPRDKADDKPGKKPTDKATDKSGEGETKAP